MNQKETNTKNKLIPFWGYLDNVIRKRQPGDLLPFYIKSFPISDVRQSGERRKQRRASLLRLQGFDVCVLVC